MSKVRVNIPVRSGMNVELGGVAIKRTTDYNDLKNRPLINGVLLEGNIPLEELGIQNISSLEYVEVV